MYDRLKRLFNRLPHWEYIAAAAALGAAFLMLADGASARGVCGPHDAIVEQLQVKYGEERTGVGLGGPDALVELYVSQGGTWTMIVTRASGLACLAASGEDWRVFDPVTPTDPSSSEEES